MKCGSYKVLQSIAIMENYLLQIASFYALYILCGIILLHYWIEGKGIIFRLMYSKRANKLTLLKFIKIYAYLFILASITSHVCFHPEATYAFNLYLGHICDVLLHYTLQIWIY